MIFEMGKCGSHMMRRRMIMVIHMMIVVMMVKNYAYADTNIIFNPCDDTKVKRLDGFTFGLAFSTKEAFFLDQIQLSPCDSRLALATKNAKLTIFRPKVDEISLLTIDGTNFNPILSGGYVVAFAGRKYAARSAPTLVADSTHTVTNLTLVLEFQQGTLENLYWKSLGCDSCSGETSVCINNTVCAVPNLKCRNHGGPIDCNVGIQLTFSGTDEKRQVLNSWYEVENLRKLSLYDLYSNVAEAVPGHPQ
ncbi:uncharacterized protein LOC18034443 [Citrus clementina]|nr:uncharacterized protein LOC18034443 [Citrus x clementina]